MLHLYPRLRQAFAIRQWPGLSPRPTPAAVLLWLALPGLTLAQAGRPTRPGAAKSNCTVVASAQPATLTLDASGTATLTAAALDNGSTTCGTGTLSASRTSFGCADLNPAALPAVRRGSLQLDRTYNQYVLSNNQVSGTTSGTFETWVKTTVAMPQFSGIMVTSTAPGDAASGTGLYLRWNGGGRVACEGSWNVAQSGSSPALNDGQWHHIAAVGEGSTCKLYIDGVLNATGTAAPNVAYSRRLMLGAERSRTAGYFGTVELDNTRVWSVPRTQAQLQDGMANETLANTYGLLLAYSYDNGAGTTVRDASGNNQPATLYSGTATLPTFTAAGGVPLVPRGVPVTLTVTDADGTTSTADTYVTVLPAALPTTALTLSNNSVTENSPVGTVVGTLGLANTGACASTTTTFELVNAAGTDYAQFSVGTGANAGQLLLATVPDYETRTSYTLRLRVTDQNYATVDRVVTIAVEDLIELSGTQTTTCGSAGATATVAVAGTAPGYAYAWSPAPGGGQGTATATGLAAGTYTVSVSKTGLATATRTYTILDDAIVPVAQAKNVTLTLDANGTATLAPTALDNGSTDNCTIAGRAVSRNAFTCADLNPPVLAATRKGSVQLDRTNSQYVLSNAQVSGSTTGTFETWVKTTVVMPQYSGIMVTSAAPGDAAAGTVMVLRWSGDGRVACDGAWAVAQTGTSPALNNGQWHHLAVVGDGSTSKLYIDGMLNNTGTCAANQTYSRRLMLGAEYQRVAGYYGTLELDNSRVWSVARTQAQLQDGMTYEQVTDATGLLLAYTYDESAGSTVRDASGNNQPATLYSGTSTSPTFTAAGGVPLVPRGVPVTLTVTDAAGNASSANAYVTVQAPAGVAAARTWTGTKNTDWADCGNWSYGLVPDAGANVSIPAGLTNYPALSGTGITVASLNVAAGASIAMGTTVLSVTGNLLNAGPALSGPVRLTGAAAQTLAGSLSSLTIDKTGGTTTLAANVDVSTALFLTSGQLSTASYTLTLGSGAMLVESDANYITGTVQTTRDLSAAGSSYDIGGLGLTLAPAAGSTAVPGSTLVQRVTGSPRSGVNGAASIARYFTITPTVDAGLNVDLKLSYRTAELNGIAPASLGLFKSETGAANSWVQQTAAVINTSDKTATLAGVGSFSVWTLGTTAQPMPVVLTEFTATAQGREAVRLAWATASEKNSHSFEVERSADGHSYSKVGTVAAAGTTAATRAYALLDAALPAGAPVLYYRLRQVDLDGTFSYSPVRVAALGGAAAGLSLFPNPAATEAATLLGAQPGTLVQVLDALGRTVATATADAAGTATLALPAGRAPGVYVVRAGAQALRLVVE